MAGERKEVEMSAYLDLSQNMSLNNDEEISFDDFYNLLMSMMGDLLDIKDDSSK